MLQAEILCGTKVDSQESCREAIKLLLQKGPENVVLTLGSKGAMFGGSSCKDGGISCVSPDPSILPDQVVDTTVSFVILCKFIALIIK